MMTPFLGELIGTCILVVLGDGIVANVLLNKTKGHGSGWIAITLGWSMAVFVAVYSVAAVSGAHINPAASIALAAAGKFPWADVPLYVAGQMIGAMIGALIVWISYRQHFEETLDGDAKLAVFCTGPAIRSPLNNLASEIIGTFILIFGILSMVSPRAASVLWMHSQRHCWFWVSDSHSAELLDLRSIQPVIWDPGSCMPSSQSQTNGIAIGGIPISRWWVLSSVDYWPHSSMDSCDLESIHPKLS